MFSHVTNDDLVLILWLLESKVSMFSQLLNDRVPIIFSDRLTIAFSLCLIIRGSNSFVWPSMLDCVLILPTIRLHGIFRGEHQTLTFFLSV